MLNPKDINKLDDYSYNRSSKESRKELEQKMSENGEFNKEANIFFRLFRGFKALEVDALNQKMNKWEEKHQGAISNPKVIKMNSLFKYAAAAILLLAFLPLGYQYLNSEMSSDELFSDNFSHIKAINYFESRGTTMAPNSEDRTPEQKAATAQAEIDQAGLIAVLSRGISAYNNHQYTDATKYFSAYMTTAEAKDKNEVEFFLAVSYLAEGNANDAKPLFQKMVKKGTRTRKADAEWYLVLTLLKENNVEQAQKNLKRIIKKRKAHAHKEKALKLQQQIDKYYVQQ
jgi:hypothetical protein